MDASKTQDRPRLSARRRAEHASTYIWGALREVRPGDRLVLACRVSTHHQDHNKNLADQETNPRERAARLGATVVGVVKHVGSGCDPWWLARAVVLAETHEAKLFAESVDRLIRSPAYTKTNQEAQARNVDLLDLARWKRA